MLAANRDQKSPAPHMAPDWPSKIFIIAHRVAQCHHGVSSAASINTKPHGGVKYCRRPRSAALDDIGMLSDIGMLARGGQKVNQCGGM